MCCKWKQILGKLYDNSAIDEKEIKDMLEKEDYDIYLLDSLYNFKKLNKEEYVNYLKKLVYKLQTETRYAEMVLDIILKNSQI